MALLLVTIKIHARHPTQITNWELGDLLGKSLVGETKHPLLRVNRHGVGKWTDILEDKNFRFNDRTAGDLKDRFRTCCPEELRTGLSAEGKSPSTSSSSLPKGKDGQPEAKSKAKTGLLSENILIDFDEDESPGTTPQQRGTGGDTRPL
jgi:hypothetical protein